MTLECNKSMRDHCASIGDSKGAIRYQVLVTREQEYRRQFPNSVWVRDQCNKALIDIFMAIEASAKKQQAWLRAAIITRNRSIGQRFRHITGSDK